MRLRLSLRNPVAGVETVKVFDKRGGRIGRESGCDWVLPDPDKVISRRHCLVEYDGDGFWLVDLSANGTFVNGSGEALGYKTRVDALEVADLAIGHYLIDVEVTDKAVDAPPMAEAFFAGSAHAVPTVNSGIPEDWANPQRPDMMKPVGASGARPSSASAVEEDAWPTSGSGFVPPIAPPITAPVAKPKPASDELLDAFLDGAGLKRRDLGPIDPAETMRQAGIAFRLMVTGLHGLLAARASLKHEMHIDRTTFSRNPLKTAPDPFTAVLALIEPPSKYGMRAGEAVSEVIGDIEGHEAAMTAGMSAALTALLERFAPERLAHGLDKSSVLENLLPAARRSRYWQEYEEQYREIIDEAECNFHQLFGEEFARAYLNTARRNPPGPRGRRP